jgi:membrane protease subunit HflC
MVDIRIKRADFPQEVAGRIFERMRSDREKISRRLRAEGEEEARTRRAAADRDVEVILAAADRDADRLRGDGEAQAISILAESLNKDPEFFSFRRSLEAYKAFLNQRTTVILSSDAPIFKFLQSPGEGSSETTSSEASIGEALTDPLGLQ